MDATGMRFSPLFSLPSSKRSPVKLVMLNDAGVGAVMLRKVSAGIGPNRRFKCSEDVSTAMNGFQATFVESP